MPESYSTQFIAQTKSRYSAEPEFVQAVEEVIGSIAEVVDANRVYQEASLLERLVEPERIVTFRVAWVDDASKVQVNKGYRVQFNSALGIYKGGLRFHPTVNQSILKFLGFEQTFKNALTGLPLGGAKGGADFDPAGKSDPEIMRFCQAFMSELWKYIGDDIDVPAGDIGVGGKEIGYMFGQYKKLTGRFNGTLTGKSPLWGGSFARTEATGYGLLYFVQEMLTHKGEDLHGKRVIISGAGNVAQYAAEKAIQLGGKVLTMSDSGGFIYDPEGITQEKLDWIKDLKEVRGGRISEYKDKFGGEYYPGQKPWGRIEADIALPCATQNEIGEEDAKGLISSGIKVVAEGANMPSSNEAIEIFQDAGVLFAPGKASNAGGVATSGLEMSQNSQKLQWTFAEVDSKLQGIMKNIHQQCVENGSHSENDSASDSASRKNGAKSPVNYVRGANIAGFKRVAEAMLAQGVV